MSESRCGVGAPWCARADEMFSAPGLHVLDVDHDAADRLVVTVETDETVAGCRRCGVVAIGHGRRVHHAHDAPAFGAPVRIAWRKRVWRCPDPGCPVGTFSEHHDLIGARAKLTTRAISWATDALAHDDTTVAALTGNHRPTTAADRCALSRRATACADDTGSGRRFAGKRPDALEPPKGVEPLTCSLRVNRSTD